jgi:hypothetical protein
MSLAASPCRLFVFGLGFVGLRVGSVARELGWNVAGSCGSAAKADALRLVGFDAHHFDLDEAYTGLSRAGVEALQASTHVLATVPPIADFDRDPLLALHGSDLSESGNVSTPALTAPSMPTPREG